jgi:hypothetical protein
MNELYVSSDQNHQQQNKHPPPPPHTHTHTQQEKIKRKTNSFPNNMDGFMPQLFNIYFIPAPRDYH